MAFALWVRLLDELEDSWNRAVMKKEKAHHWTAERQNQARLLGRKSPGDAEILREHPNCLDWLLICRSSGLSDGQKTVTVGRAWSFARETMSAQSLLACAPPQSRTKENPFQHPLAAVVLDTVDPACQEEEALAQTMLRELLEADEDPNAVVEAPAQLDQALRGRVRTPLTLAFAKGRWGLAGILLPASNPHRPTRGEALYRASVKSDLPSGLVSLIVQREREVDGGQSIRCMGLQQPMPNLIRIGAKSDEIRLAGDRGDWFAAFQNNPPQIWDTVVNQHGDSDSWTLVWEGMLKQDPVAARTAWDGLVGKTLTAAETYDPSNQEYTDRMISRYAAIMGLPVLDWLCGKNELSLRQEERLRAAGMKIGVKTPIANAQAERREMLSLLRLPDENGAELADGIAANTVAGNETCEMGYFKKSKNRL